MQARIQLVAIVGASVLLLTVLEMVRRRRLMERYALLWLLSAIVLLALAIWSGALAKISHAIGVIYPPNALFFIAIGFILLLLLHFSAAVSRLSDQSETLAQRQALLDERLRHHERLNGDRQGLNGDSGARIAGGPAENSKAKIAHDPGEMTRTPID
ncbi:MAG: DUF2304 domain-containing protein [Solirubrobacteraceae bacterium]